MRKLASIREVYDIRPIEGRDMIEQALIDGWNVIVKKDEFKPGDLCVYVEIDSKMPARPEFEFLAKRDYVIKTMKMAGVRSEGIAFPLSILPKRTLKDVFVGKDVTKVLGITQYNKEPEVSVKWTQRLLNWFMRFEVVRKVFKNSKQVKNARVGFPNWISKTDEERIQNCTKVLDLGLTWRATEKLDGSSATFGLRLSKYGEPEYIVCSRNIQLFDTDNVWHRISEELNMRQVLEQLANAMGAQESVVIQGEIIGPKIQQNKYKLDAPMFRMFNFKIDGKQISYADGELKIYGIENVPIHTPSMRLEGHTVDSLLQYATFKSAINPTVLAEGLVFRSIDNIDGRFYSFKAVSPDFLIKNKE